MNSDIEAILEFDKIKALIARYATSGLGRSLAENMIPAKDIAFIRRMLDICTEAKNINIIENGLPLRGLRDIRSITRKAEVSGSILEPDELLHVSSTAKVAGSIKDFAEGYSEKYPIIAEIAEGITAFPKIEEGINACIDPEGNILDTASHELHRIRRQLVSMRDKIISMLESILHSSQYQTAIQENVITLRNDRFVIPVKQNLKNSFPGVVQARSASGITAFIEPIGAVELNNQLHELASDEKKEIRRILKDLTDKVRDVLPELETTTQILAELDLINAKALFCIKLGATKPELNDRGYINLIQAKHPLLQIKIDRTIDALNERLYNGDQKKDINNNGSVIAPANRLAPEKIVPVNFYIGDSFDTLVITGPNTGGKTVALKTIGLLTLMMQTGLHIPAKEGSQMSVFNQVFADIGDEQSIEQNLSTFSSHITRINSILKRLDSSSLVLLDELGAGTEPSEGAALGMAILDYLHAQGVRTVATTHHDSLKAYVYSQDGMENASVAFDLKTLQPTYELRIGLPGSSNALRIAERLGLPDEITETAKSYLRPETLQMTDLLSTVEEMQRGLEEQKKLVDEKAISASRIQQEHEQLLRQLKSKKKDLEREALNEASSIIQSAKVLVENTIAEIHKEKASTDSIRRARQTLVKAREEIQVAVDQVSHEETGSKIPREGRKPDRKELKPGDKVFIKSLRCHGTLAGLPDAKDMVQVIAGNAKISVSLSEIRLFELTSATDSKAKPDNAGLFYTKKSGVPDTLNLRGYRAAEALDKADKYLDDAALAGLRSISIIHGSGTGALRSAMIGLLNEHPHVETFRPGNRNEGGLGVTIVELK